MWILMVCARSSDARFYTMAKFRPKNMSHFCQINQQKNCFFKVLSLLEACFDLILGSSLHMKIQIMSGNITKNLVSNPRIGRSIRISLLTARACEFWWFALGVQMRAFTLWQNFVQKICHIFAWYFSRNSFRIHKTQIWSNNFES